MRAWSVERCKEQPMAGLQGWEHPWWMGPTGRRRLSWCGSGHSWSLQG